MKIKDTTIAEETRKLLHNGYPLSRRQKTKIRQDAVKKFINTRYSGELISTQDLVDAAGYDKKDIALGYSFIANMVKSGHIFRSKEIGTRRNSYSVNDSWVAKTRGKSRSHKPVKIEQAPQIDENELDFTPAEEVIFSFPHSMVHEEDTLKERAQEAIEEFFSDDRFNFTVTITKKTNDETFGNRKIAELDMSNVSKANMASMIAQVIDKLEV